MKIIPSNRLVTRIGAMTLVTGLATLPVVAENAPDPSATPIELVKVGDFTITNLHLALFASQTGQAPEDAERQILLLNELVNNVMVAQSASGKALIEQPAVMAALEVAQARLVAQTYVREQLENTPVGDAEVEQLYASRYGAGQGREFKARHILLETEAEAIAVIEALDAGQDFTELASSRSTGPSKSVGGDLGWFDGGQMVPAFSAAVQQLQDGSYSREPVKTQFGWHVILLEDSREVPPPSLESVRPELEKELRQIAIATALSRMRVYVPIEVLQGAE